VLGSTNYGRSGQAAQEAMDATTPRAAGAHDPGAGLASSPENGWGAGPDDLFRGPVGGAAPKYVSPRGCIALGILLALLVFAALYSLVVIWPAVEAATADSTPASATVTFLAFEWSPRPEVALLLMVICASALGGALHAAVSFTDYVGNRRLATSWIWWYLLRVHVGSALAVLFYFALRGGLFSATSATDAINPFGIAALAGLVGLFSKQATDKLRELFDTMFRTAPGQGDDQRGDSIVNPLPVLGGVEPSRLDTGTELLDVRLRGQGFVPQSVVRVTRSLADDGVLVQRTSELVHAGELRVRLDPRDVLEEGVAYVTVFNPQPGGGLSRAAEIQVAAPANGDGAGG
jgi:hypothetical protein